MPTVTIQPARRSHVARALRIEAASWSKAQRLLLLCGLLSSTLYVGMNVWMPLQWEGYSAASHTISELSAIDAPTRALWVPLGIAYSLLLAAFGLGVLQTADNTDAPAARRWFARR